MQWNTINRQLQPFCLVSLNLHARLQMLAHDHKYFLLLKLIWIAAQRPLQNAFRQMFHATESIHRCLQERLEKYHWLRYVCTQRCQPLIRGLNSARKVVWPLSLCAVSTISGRAFASRVATRRPAHFVRQSHRQLARRSVQINEYPRVYQFLQLFLFLFHRCQQQSLIELYPSMKE